MFSRILNFLFVNVFSRKKLSFRYKQQSYLLTFYDLFWFLNESPFRTNQSKRQISWFVKRCDEFVIGQVHLMVGKISCGTLLVKWWDLLEKLKLLFRKEKKYCYGQLKQNCASFSQKKTINTVQCIVILSCKTYRIITPTPAIFFHYTN